MSATESIKEKRYVGVKETVLYGVANGGQVIGYNLVRNQLLFYFTIVFGVPEHAFALMIAIVGVWDAFNDPLMGTVVDKTRTRFGKLRPWLLFTPLPLGIITILLFGGAQFMSGVSNTTSKIVYMWVIYLIWEFIYTLGDIPFWGLSAAISPSPKDRSNAITSARFISNIIGGIVGLLIPIFIDLSKSGKIGWDLKQVFLFMGILAGTVGVGLFSLAGICTRERVVQSSDEPSVFACFRYLFKNKPLLLIVASNVLATVGGFADAFSQFFYTMTLGKASYSIIAGIPGTVVGFIAYGCIPWFEKRWSSRQIVIRIAVFKTVIAGVVFLCGVGAYTNPWVVIPLMMIQGFFNGIFMCLNMVIPTKMIGDTVDYMEWKTGERNEGMTFSLLTFISKLTGSFSSAFAALIMPLIGLAEVDEELVLAADSAVNTNFWLWGCMTVIPPALALISLIPYKFYDLEGEKLKKIQEEIKAHREQRAKEISVSSED